MIAINRDKLLGVSFQGCGFCGWHYRYYAEMQGGHKVELGEEEYYDEAWTEDENYAHLTVRANQLLKELLREDDTES